MATERQTVFEFRKKYPDSTAAFGAADFMINSYAETLKKTPLYQDEYIEPVDHYVRKLDDGTVVAYLKLHITNW